MSRPPLIERRPTSPGLALYVAVSIVAGFGVLGWATATLPIDASIANRGLPRIVDDPSESGLLFWIGLGLLGALRTTSFGRRAVLTFHLPFEVAAMTLGGPVAGGWVAAISTIEARELREVPWFGTLANHAILALSGVLGGLVVMTTRASVSGLFDGQLATLVATLAGAFVFCALDVGMTLVVVGLREHLTPIEAACTFDRSFRKTVGGEVVLGWLLALAYGAVAWWAPIVCVAVVLLVWQANDEHEMTNNDPMSGLLNRKGFQEQFGVAVARVRRGRLTAVLLMLDLDGFKAINDTYSHGVGDDVLLEVGRRLDTLAGAQVFLAHLHGDEFVALATGVGDEAAATALAERFRAVIEPPIPHERPGLHVSATIGFHLLPALGDRAGAMRELEDAMRQADEHMSARKARGERRSGPDRRVGPATAG